MPTLYITKVLPTSVSVTSAQTGYGADNLLSESLGKPWRSVDNAQQDVVFNYAVAKTIKAISVSDVNFASAQVWTSISGAAFTNVGTLTCYANKEGRYRGFHELAVSANVTGLRLRILTGTPNDGKTFFRIGSMLTFAAVVAIPPGPEWGYNPKWVIPRVATNLSNGQRARAATGTPYHVITAKAKPQGTEDWTSFFAGLNAGVCLFCMNLPALRQWQTWPVILENDEINGTESGPATGEFDITLREVV